MVRSSTQDIRPWHCSKPFTRFQGIEATTTWSLPAGYNLFPPFAFSPLPNCSAIVHTPVISAIPIPTQWWAYNRPWANVPSCSHKCIIPHPCVKAQLKSSFLHEAFLDAPQWNSSVHSLCCCVVNSTHTQCFAVQLAEYTSYLPTALRVLRAGTPLRVLEPHLEQGWTQNIAQYLRAILNPSALLKY